MTMIEYYAGAINPDWAANWDTINFDTDEGNPYSVLVDPQVKVYPLHRYYPSDLDEYLSDKKVIDWGSCAWRGKRKDFEKLFAALKADLGSISFMNDDDLYAFVFIELY